MDCFGPSTHRAAHSRDPGWPQMDGLWPVNSRFSIRQPARPGPTADGTWWRAAELAAALFNGPLHGGSGAPRAAHAEGMDQSGDRAAMRIGRKSGQSSLDAEAAQAGYGHG